MLEQDVSSGRVKMEELINNEKSEKFTVFKPSGSMGPTK